MRGEQLGTNSEIRPFTERFRSGLHENISQ